VGSDPIGPAKPLWWPLDTFSSIGVSAAHGRLTANYAFPATGHAAAWTVTGTGDDNGTAACSTDSSPNWVILPGSAEIGKQPVNLSATDTTGASSGWTQLGTWTIDATAPISLGPVPFTSSVGEAETLNGSYGTDTTASNVASVGLCIGNPGSPATSLYAKYSRRTNSCTFVTPAALTSDASNQTITTPLGVLNCASTAVSLERNQIDVSFNITPAASLTGVQPIDLIASDVFGNSSVWIQYPDWTITSTQTSGLGSGGTLT